jgi:PTH2 family peptidyl-tRNA hydrolase
MSDMKQVIVIRTDLDLSGGKAVAQGCHASMGAYFDSMDRWGPIGPDMVSSWEEGSNPKICLAIDGEAELLALAKKCDEANIGHYLVRDAGRTEVEPLTPTALGIGPEFNRHINKLTKHLSLY